MAKQNVKVTVVCSNCGNQFEMDGGDWDRSRKPWCKSCTNNLVIGSSRFQPPTKQSKRIKRVQRKAQRQWRTPKEDYGVVRVVKDWRPIKGSEGDSDE